MALKWNGTTISTNDTIVFNDYEILKVYFDGVLVWEKSSGDSGDSAIEYEDCTNCGGTGEVDCSKCVVGGECTVCSGTGFASPQECPYCEAGECYRCHGSKLQPSGCPNCIVHTEGRLSWPKCGQCDYSGIIWRCQSCGTVSGTGGRMPTACAKESCTSTSFKDSPCDRCGGVGSFNPDYYWHCSVCDGYGNYGQCSTCGGEGGPCTYCGGSHYISAGQCSVCNGTGRCPNNCDSGKLTCTRCNGSGQIIKTTREYSGASGNITMTLPSGESMLVTFEDNYWKFSADFDLQIVTWSDDTGPKHWGYATLDPEFAHNVDITVYDFDTYSSEEYNNPSAGIFSNPNIEAEYISAMGTIKANLSYDKDRNVWTLYHSTADTMSASIANLSV